MKKDLVHLLPEAQKVVDKFRDKLQKEKAKLESRLAEIKEALGEAMSKVIDPGIPRKRVKRGKKRVKNEMSLREAVLKVTAAKPLNRKEIVEQLDIIGYRFNTKNPVGSLNMMLHTHKAEFVNKDKKISPKKK